MLKDKAFQVDHVKMITAYGNHKKSLIYDYLNDPDLTCLYHSPKGKFSVPYKLLYFKGYNLFPKVSLRNELPNNLHTIFFATDIWDKEIREIN